MGIHCDPIPKWLITEKCVLRKGKVEYQEARLDSRKDLDWPPKRSMYKYFPCVDILESGAFDGAKARDKHGRRQKGSCGPRRLCRSLCMLSVFLCSSQLLLLMPAIDCHKPKPGSNFSPHSRKRPSRHVPALHSILGMRLGSQARL